MNSTPKYLIPSNQQIISEALALGITPAKHAAMLGMEGETIHAQLWPEINNSDKDKDGYLDIQLCGNRKDMFSRYVKNISESIQFPESSVFITGLGVIAAAMARNFKFDYYGSQAPVNLYAVISQPPGTGKSGALNKFKEPFMSAFDFLNGETSKTRAKIISDICSLKEELKGEKNKIAFETKSADLSKAEKDLSDNPLFTPFRGDATIEALEMSAGKQRGYFSFVSDEMGGFNTLLGITYGDGKSVKSANLLLSGFDGDLVNSTRIGRGDSMFNACGSVFVIAQDMTINALMEAGALGNGLAERFLILRERPLIGYRDFSKPFVPIDKDLARQFSDLAFKIVNHSDVVLKFSSESEDFINSVRAMHEPKLRQGGEYDHGLLRGTIGKMDKQVKKIACILHVITKWVGNSEPLVVDLETTMWAMSIFDGMFQQYLAAVSNQGVAGNDAYIEKVISVIERKLERGNRTTLSRKIKVHDLRGLLKNSKPFSGLQNITATLKEKVLPALEEKGMIVVKDNVIYVSPKM